MIIDNISNLINTNISSLVSEAIIVSEDNSITDQQIAIIERKLGVKFPSDFIEFVKKYNGGHFKPVITIKSKNIVIENVPSWKSENEYNIVRLYELTKHRLPKKLIPIFIDPFGNSVCMDFNTNPPNIKFWDHEVNPEDPDNEVIIDVARNFAEFKQLAKIK